MFGGLDFGGAVQDIIAATNDLLSKGYKKVGITGFCMGGALTIAAAANGAAVSAVVPFYGVPDLS